MITYELAKKLKKAGFLQPDKYLETTKGSWWVSGKWHDTSIEALKNKKPYISAIYECEEPDPLECHYKKDVCYIPTLSELIKACGEDGFWISVNGRGKEWNSLRGKIGELNPEKYKIEVENYISPEEAVARLYLLIQKMVRIK